MVINNVLLALLSALSFSAIIYTNGHKMICATHTRAHTHNVYTRIYSHISKMQYLVVMGPINGGRWFGAVTYHASEIHGAVLVYEHLWFSNDRRDRFWTIENKGKYDSPYVIISLRIEQK